MNIIKNRVNDVTVLDIQGVIKLGESAREFSSYLEKVLNDETGPVMINFEAINYMDSTGLGEVFLGLNWVIGRHQRNPSKLAPYESGVPLLDENRKRINVRFYQIAMLFILFDIEAAFLYPWAVIYRDATRTPAGTNWFVFG